MVSQQQKTLSLLNNDGTITEKFCSLLKEVFEQFDHDKDGMLSKEELRSYFMTLNDDGEYLEDLSLDFHMMIICGNTVGFTLKNFYTFYEFQTKYKPYETIKDLLALYSEETLLERLV